MSENVTLPGVRVPFVDNAGCITREWLPFLQGIYNRSGGFQGFSNQELFGDSATLQSYDELLERISSLEASNRDLVRGMQQLMQFSGLEAQQAVQQAIGDALDKLTVRGTTRLATRSGQVVVGAPVAVSTSLLHVGGQADASEYRVADVKVVGAREAGFTAMSGAADKATALNSGSATLPQVAARVNALQAALTTHGLIGA